MKTFNQYITERFVNSVSDINTKEDVYNYIVKKYGLDQIDDCRQIGKCPHKIDLTDIEVSNKIDTTDLFNDFMCVEIDISSWNIPYIGKNMFSGCIAETIKYNEQTVEHIKEKGFRGCYKLSEIKFTKNIKTIGDFAFFGCDDLTRINIPSSVTELGERAFGSCDTLKDVTFEQGSQIKKLKASTFYKCAIEYIELPESLESIDTRVFAECEQLKEITLSDNIQHINMWAFHGCTQTIKVNVPKDKKEYYEQLFKPIIINAIIKSY